MFSLISRFYYFPLVSHEVNIDLSQIKIFLIPAHISSENSYFFASKVHFCTFCSCWLHQPTFKTYCTFPLLCQVIFSSKKILVLLLLHFIFHQHLCHSEWGTLFKKRAFFNLMKCCIYLGIKKNLVLTCVVLVFFHFLLPLYLTSIWNFCKVNILIQFEEILG